MDTPVTYNQSTDTSHAEVQCKVPCRKCLPVANLLSRMLALDASVHVSVVPVVSVGRYVCTYDKVS